MSQTPMMRQYDEAKKACGDALLLFRMGDFYELFHEDAKIAAKILGLTLTSRDKSANPIPMAGFPYHQLEGYLAKLIKMGYRAAVCEQVENPQTAQGLVKREITQVVSPGTITDHELLDPAESNFLVSIFHAPTKGTPKSMSSSSSTAASGAGPSYGIAWADSSTGRFLVTAVDSTQLDDLLARLNAKEAIVPQGQTSFLQESTRHPFMITERPRWTFSLDNATETLKKQFGISVLDGLGIEEFGSVAVSAAGALIDYLKENHKSGLLHFDRLVPYRRTQYVEIDGATWRSLEISQTIRSGQRNGSLLGVMDCCQTPMGSRQLGEWMRSPLTQIDAIQQRLDAVEELTQSQSLRQGLRDFLKQTYDLQRLLARVSVGRSSPRDLECVATTLQTVPQLKSLLKSCQSGLLKQLEVDLDPCHELQSELSKALVDGCPPNTKDSGFIRTGYHEPLDEYRTLAAGGKQWIAQYQQSVIEQTGIPHLKVGYNKVFGYYLETTNAHRDKLPPEFIRKQTLKNAERFITPELKEYEEKVLSADNQANDLEMQLFEQLRMLVQTATPRLKTNADIIANLDCFTGLAQLAVEQTYIRPKLENGNQLKIVDGKHPVIDRMESLGTFVPNSTWIDDESGFIHLITGPNMAGKSTYIRQVALIALMAQVGSFVPASEATIGIVDKIFARVGASDELSRGQSTFMVEMTETARILNTATSRSLVILDEIGRGTSTYDGVSLAWAIVEYMHDQIGCRTLFATHYHELTELEKDLKGVRNYNVAVKEWEEKIIFLHKIVRGSADQSYGIHVAQLAGVPSWVNGRAKQILQRLESSGQQQTDRQTMQALADAGSPSTGNDAASHSIDGGNSKIQLTLFGPATHPLVDKIKALDANQLTPLDALQMLHSWKKEL